jgi:hypothetical protein
MTTCRGSSSSHLGLGGSGGAGLSDLGGGLGGGRLNGSTLGGGRGTTSGRSSGLGALPCLGVMGLSVSDDAGLCGGSSRACGT